MNKNQNAQKWRPLLEPLLQQLPDIHNPHWDQRQENDWHLALQKLLDQHTHTKPHPHHLDF